MFLRLQHHKYHLCNLRSWFSYVPSKQHYKQKTKKINEKILRETLCLWGTIIDQCDDKPTFFSGNDLVPSCKKPLPEYVLTKIADDLLRDKATMSLAPRLISE